MGSNKGLQREREGSDFVFAKMKYQSMQLEYLKCFTYLRRSASILFYHIASKLPDQSNDRLEDILAKTLANLGSFVFSFLMLSNISLMEQLPYILLLSNASSFFLSSSSPILLFAECMSFTVGMWLQFVEHQTTYRIIVLPNIRL